MFYDRFLILCDEHGVSRTKACIDCGISRTAWRKWENCGVPNGVTLNVLADYFHTTVDDLLSAKKAPAAEAGDGGVSDDDIKFALFGGSGEITDEMYEEVKRFAAFVRQREKEKSEGGKK